MWEIKQLFHFCRNSLQIETFCQFYNAFTTFLIPARLLLVLLFIMLKTLLAPFHVKIFLFCFQWIIAFIRKGLKLDPADSLFVYVNQAFAPAPGKWPPPWKSDQDMTFTIMLWFVRSPEECKIYRIALVYNSNTFQFFSDQTVRNLTNCFGSEGKLSLYYSKTQAWGWRK